MKMLVFINKWNMHCKNNIKVNFGVNNSSRDNQYTVIFYISVWPEVALEIDFFEKTYFLELSNTRKHVFGNE